MQRTRDTSQLFCGPPLGEAACLDLLERVLARATETAPRGIVIFDLDSTLLDNRPRQARIMREYGERAGVAALARAEADHWDGWDFRQAMRNAGLDAAEVKAHEAPFRELWHQTFFTSEYCRVDRPIPGAPGFARAVAETGTLLCYVTGRHEGMRAGTLHCFRETGFPVPDGDRVRLIMKPDLSEHDDAFKERALAELRALGTVVAAFDNEPSHINGYRAAFPEALVVHLATDHSPREIRVRDDIPSIRDFAALAVS